MNGFTVFLFAHRCNELPEHLHAYNYFGQLIVCGRKNRSVRVQVQCIYYTVRVLQRQWRREKLVENRIRTTQLVDWKKDVYNIKLYTYIYIDHTMYTFIYIYI